ncbi:MAG: TIGR02679 domain-containing protein [Emergencia sp.]
MSGHKESEDIRRECLEYFRQSPVWNRVLEGFREKYISYGRFGGKIVLKNLKGQDIDELEGFFGQNFHGQKSVTVSGEKFRHALECSRFREVTPELLLEMFFEEVLMGKQEKRALRERKKQKLLQKFLKDCEGTPAEEHIQYLLKIAKENENQELEDWDSMLRLTAAIYNNLPYRRNRKLYLAVFAAMLTGNPHAFDNGTPGGKLLYQVIQSDLEVREVNVESSDIFPAYRRQKSYLLTGIMLDDISNYAMLYGVQAVKSDGSSHKGMKGFDAERHAVQVPLAVISEWKEIHCVHKEIYIVENPTIFAMLCASAEHGTEKSYMCMNGQPRLAGLMTLDLIAKGNNRIYYAGDLDPEGLLIAQKLSGYYKGEFNYWHMGVSDYEQSRSDEIISPKRMKILEHISDERLLPVAKEIEKHGTAGYQEKIADWM